MRTHHLLEIAVLLALLPGALLAQAHRAIILGRIVDSSGAVLPGVEVKITQKATNVVRATVTNASGNYEVPGLFPGVYRIEASLPGFKTGIVDDLPVQSDQRVQVDLKLEVGQITDLVTVTAEQAVLDRAKADVNTIVDQRKLADLPIGQGNATYLFITAPGVMTADSVGIGGNGSDVQPLQRAGSNLARINGSPTGTSEYAIDGDPNTQRGNTGAGGGTSFNLQSDVVQEVRVQTNSFDASIGHTGGATIDLVMKQGTNDYHVSGFKHFRRPRWNANTFDGNRNGVPRQNIQFNQWGFSGGGPVWLGPLYNGKNRTFFYYGYEEWKGLSPNPPVTGTTPLPQHLQGDFSNLLSLGSQYQLYDPVSGRLMADGRIQRDPFPNNVIPTTRINPTATAMVKMFPLPNLPGLADGRNNYSADATPFPRGFRNSTLRVDHNLNAAHKLSGKWLLGRTEIPSFTPYGVQNMAPSGLDIDNLNVGVSDVWTLGPSLIAEFRASFLRAPARTVSQGVGIDYDSIGFSALKPLTDTSIQGFPSIPLPGYAFGTLFTGFQNQQGSLLTSEIRALGTNWTKIQGNHSFKFGADWRGYMEATGQDDFVSFSITGGNTAGPFSNSPLAPIGGSLADFLLGTYSSATLRQPVKPANFARYYGMYFNDDWKVTPRLTLNLGIRYELEDPATERYDRSVADFAYTTENPIAAEARANYALSPIPELPVSNFQIRGGTVFAGGNEPRQAYNTDGNNFAPRVGLAWQVGSETVVRAGYGVFFIPYGQRFLAGDLTVPGFDAITTTLSSLDGGLSFANFVNNPFPAGLEKATGSSQGLKTFLGQGLNLAQLPRNKPNAYNQRWQIGIQRVFRRNYKVEVRYVANRTIKMPISRDINALPNQYLSTSPERDQATIDRLSRLVTNPFRGISGVTGTLGSATTVAASQLLRPYPHFGGSILVSDTQGRSWYDALQIEFERRFSSGLSFQTSYTWSKTIDALSLLNTGDVSPEKTIADQHRPHIWRLMGIYELPFGRGRAIGSGVSRGLDYVIGGWQIQSIAYVQSGTPISFGNVLFRGDFDDIPISDPVRERLFSTSGFERGTANQLASNLRTFPGRIGDVRSPHGTVTDFSLMKKFRIGERFLFEARAEAYNIFNNHFFPGSEGCGLNTSCRIDVNPLSTNFGGTNNASVGRAMQIVLKAAF